MRGRSVPRVDLAIGVVLTTLGLFITLAPNGAADGTWVDTALIGFVTVPVIWRRSAPLACALALTAGVVVSGAPTFDQIRCGVAIPAALLTLYPVGAREELRHALGGLIAVLAGMVFLSVTDSNLSAAALVFVVPLCAGVWLAGRVVRSRDALAGELAARTRLLEQRRSEVASLAAEVERTRLAGMLEAAAHRRVREMVRLAERGAAAPDRALFGEIERAGRESLNEMRGLLGVLRSDDPRVRTPLPRLAQLPPRLEVEGERRPLADGIELAAYRVVEHALPAGRVRVRYLADALELELEGTLPDAAHEWVLASGGTLAREGTRLRVRMPAAVAHA